VRMVVSGCRWWPGYMRSIKSIKHSAGASRYFTVSMDRSRAFWPRGYRQMISGAKRGAGGAGGGTYTYTRPKPLKRKKNSRFKDLASGTVLQNFAQNFLI
jgi:hypothetical protein